MATRGSCAEGTTLYFDWAEGIVHPTVLVKMGLYFKEVTLKGLVSSRLASAAH